MEMEDRMSLTPNPPSTFGKHTFSHLIQAILFCSDALPHKNFLCSRTILFSTFLGTLKKEKKYIGMDVSTEFIRITLPPKDGCLCFQAANFLSHLVMIGSHV